jgi:tetratricopeptide (TPR) repeat protein
MKFPKSRVLVLSILLAIAVGVLITIHLSRSPRFNPNSAQAHYLQGKANYQKTNWDRAMADFSRVIELNPRFGNAYVYRGLVHFYKRDLDRALADYNRALEINPKDDVAYADRGLAYYHKGDYDRALADYNRAIECNRALELSSQYAKAFYSKAALLDRMGRSNEALEAYQSFLKYAQPRDIGHIQQAQGKIEALKRRPQETQTAATPAPGPLPKEDGDQTLAKVNRGLERDSTDAEARFQKAELLDQAGKKSEALEAYKTFLRYCPPQARAQMIQATERIRALER